MVHEERVGTGGEVCRSSDALDDAKLCESMAAISVGISEHATKPRSMAPSSWPIPAVVNRSFPPHLKRRKQRRRGKATRGVLAQQERINTEGQCQSTHVPDDCELCAQMPSTAVGTSEYVTATESMASSISTEVGVASTSGCEPSPSNGMSVRIAQMMQVRSEYASAVEFEIEASKVHWSELDDPTSDDEDENTETDLEVYERLKKKWPGFFRDYDDNLVVGEKIAEGGQAEIFKVKWHVDNDSVLKVFKEGYLLRDLEKQWPLSMLQNRPEDESYFSTDHSCFVYGGTLLKNGRFAFRIFRYWGDLRKLIDLRMQRNNNQRPPFTNSEVGYILFEIANGMEALHKHSIVHRDLKASNVLIRMFTKRSRFNEHIRTLVNFVYKRNNFVCDVADFESSVGVVGTGYWRAPEILHAIKSRSRKSHLFTEKSDVYSYAMTCYEVLTGCIPFEDLGGTCYDIVINGRRPEIPHHVDPLLKILLNRCWHADPLERPSFKDILEQLKEIYPILQRYYTFYTDLKKKKEEILEKNPDQLDIDLHLQC